MREVTWLRQTAEAARQALIIQTRGKMTLMLVGVSVTVAILAFFLPDRAAMHSIGTDFFGIVVYWLVFQFGLPVTVLYYGVSTLHDDLSDRTVTYQFVRPLHRSSLLIGKWLAVSLLCWALVAIFLAMLFLAFTLPARPWKLGLGVSPELLSAFLAAAALACPAYAAVGLLFGAWFRRPIVWAAVFVVGWEFVASNLPPQAGIRGATVADPIRRWLLADLNLDSKGDLAGVLTGSMHGYNPAGFGDPIRSLLIFTCTALGLCAWLYTRREYDAQPRD